MEAFRMTAPRFDRFLLILCALYFVGLCHAIYDPSVTTIKPPKRRETVLPWYLSGKDYPEPTEDSDPSRSPKWQVDPDDPRKPVVFNSDTKSWTPWRKPSGSEIEQRTEISGDRQKPIDTNQKHDWFMEYDQSQQHGYQHAQQGYHQNRYPTSDDKWYGNRGSDQHSSSQLGIDDDFYEGQSGETMKSHKEKILLTTKSKETVAQYDRERGIIICPGEDATGQFVYPLDCKFFVNCWKGRAFIQPCAPGTLFNPKTLECDFPQKVECYVSEIGNSPKPGLQNSHEARESFTRGHQGHPNNGRLQELSQIPRCPPDVSGLFPHATYCTKFLQCANGVGYVMDCGPGTVFNPITTVCDWPYNVRGCEDAYKSTEETHDVPPIQHDKKKSGYNNAREPKKISCPPDYSGLLPHADTCKKFLQCAHGITYIMDCGPGTAFNPLTSVCDWPYNVPGCSEEKPAFNLVPTTTARPWSSVTQGPTSGHGHHQPGGWPGHGPTPSTTLSPDWNSHLRPTWRPTWTPATPKTTVPPWTNQDYRPYEHHNHNNNHHGNYNPNYNPNYQQPPTYNQGASTQDQQQHQPPNYPPHHHHHQHNHGPTYNPDRNSENPNNYDHRHPQGFGDSVGQETNHDTRYPQHGNHWNYPSQKPGFQDQTVTRSTEDQFSGWQFSGPLNRTRTSEGNRPPNVPMYNPNRNTDNPNNYNHQQPQGFGDNVGQETTHDTRNPYHGNHWNSPAQKPGFQDQTVTRSPEELSYQWQFSQPANRTRIPEANPPPNRRTGLEFIPNRQDYGRNVPESHRLPEDRTPAPNGNVYVDSDYDLSGKERPIGGAWSSRTNKTELIWLSRNRTLSGESGASQGGAGWNPQGQGQTQPASRTQPHPWEQGGINHDDKLREWKTRTNIDPQSATDNEVDTGLDQWPSKTNILSHKGPSGSGGTYPSNNGTGGHFITKGIEVNQGHSNTKTFGSNKPIDLPVVNITSSGFRPRNDTRTNRAFNFSTGAPIPDRRSPFHGPVNSSYGPAVNFIGQSNVGFRPNQSSEYPETSTWGNYYPNVPATELQPPPYQPLNNQSRFGSNGFLPIAGLQPPYHGTNHRLPSSNATPEYSGSNYPSVLSVELQPPPYQPVNNQSRYGSNGFLPIGSLQPPHHDTNHWTPSSNATPEYSASNYPSVPSVELQPPFYESPRPQFGRPNPAFKPKNITHYPEFSTNLLQPNRPVNSRLPFPSYPSFNPNRPQQPQIRNKTEPALEKSVAPVKKAIPEVLKPKPLGLESSHGPSVPTVSIEGSDSSKEDEFDSDPIEDVSVVEPDLNVDVLDETRRWKPMLVYENKTTTTTTTPQTFVMKIPRKKTNVEVFNVEAAPYHQEEPPFPSYYIPPVQPLSHSNKATVPTPISGQVIRLRGGPGPHEGYVEVQGVSPGWGVVCDSRNNWTIKEANVVCRQLGYIRGAEMAWQGRHTRGGVPTWVAANSVTCFGNETKFQSCTFIHNSECRVDRDAIGVRCLQNRVAHCRDDEIPHDGQCYHLTDSEIEMNHGEALEYCKRRGARLIDITNQLENDFISEWLQQKHPKVESVMTSGVGFNVLNRVAWIWEDSSRAVFRFSKWWPGWKEDRKESPTITTKSACVVMKRKFPCYENPNSTCDTDYFFWDAENCTDDRMDYSYICERPYEDIGCSYGKGGQYNGTANVTASGKHCLPWADPKVAHPLTINVVNRDVREKLKGHNYCRNPNPNKERQPWCFAAPNGHREPCDIPSCGNIGSERAVMAGQCKPKHFECLPGECIPSRWVCDDEEDCTNGADERSCMSHLNLFQKSARKKLEGYYVENWLNTPLKTCALRCKEADFTCRSFAHKAAGNICLLSDSNIGTSGLKRDPQFDHYEMKEQSLKCDGLFVCKNGKCIDQDKVCNGKNDCHDRSDENMCTVKTLGYDIRLAGANASNEGRIEVKVFDVWGQVCDDGFNMTSAEVICKELGFPLGALEVRPGGFYGNLEPPSRFMVDQLSCHGNETSLRECEFDGWGVHDCQPEEAAGVVCKIAVDSCQEGYWKCDNIAKCIQLNFICDTVEDCDDKSDESPSHCNAPFEIRLANGSSPLEGRVEVRHHGIWGTMCDDDFSSATAAVICRSLGYGGPAIAKKNGFFGPGEGPIWLDEVFCYGNETQLNRCEHNDWAQHNCEHNEDAGVICSPGDVNEPKFWEAVPHVPEPSVNDLLPANCGKRSKDFNDDEDLIFAKVVHGTVAPKGTYPWQASIRIRSHSSSSHWCGAVMLSPLHVLTAAHCLKGYNKGTYFVRAGDYNTQIDEGTEAEANIEDYYIHEEFRKGHQMNNDIALVLLKGHGIPLGKDIMPICLPHENTEYPAGLNCTISGFGSTQGGKSRHSYDLRYGWVPLLDQSVCRAEYVYGANAISDGMLCAGYLDEGVDTCDGDSGGPLACYHNGAFTLYGITSWGQHCGKANKPGVYVRVSHYRRWIDQKIKESLAGR